MEYLSALYRRCLDRSESKNIARLVKSALVGLSGVGVNMTGLRLLIGPLGLLDVSAQAFSFVFGTTTNSI